MDVVDKLFVMFEAFHHIGKIHIAFPDCVQELPPPFLPTGSEIIELPNISEVLLVQFAISQVALLTRRRVHHGLPVVLHHLHHRVHTLVLCHQILQ